MSVRPGLLFLILVGIYLIGFGIDLMDKDASQYAAISREMLVSGQFLQLYDAGVDYLDKPPFLFWISALGMKLFGIHPIGYRLPSLFFALLAIYACYRLALLYYKKEIALWSAWILASTQGFFLMTHDVRTDTVLMGCVIFSTWQWAEWFQAKKWKYLVIASIAMACGMMTKGPIALLVPVFAIGSQVLAKRQYTDLLRWQYLVALFLIALLLAPMTWGLYQQFDMHPEKIVNGQSGVSGIRFFYWTQSFGRITGGSSWDNQKGLGFLLANMSWSFFPWILFFLPALAVQLYTVIRQRWRLTDQQEVITLGGFVLSYLALASSSYQLPHYIFVAFPFAAILTSVFIQDLFINQRFSGLKKIITYIQPSVLGLIFLLLVALLFYVFPDSPSFAPWLAIGLGIAWLYGTISYRKHALVIPYSSLAAIMSIQLLINLFVYPALLEYQAGSQIGRWMRSHDIPAEKTYLYQYTIGRSLHFYSQGIVPRKDDALSIPAGSYIITPAERLADFGSEGKEFNTLLQRYDYPISRLQLKFLLPSTRQAQLRPIYLIRLKS
jgi:4-amino-4-deoxy-L-arabinose transferase-like glycosyltransferase